MRRGSSIHAADNTVSGVVSNGSTWVETFVVKDQDGNNVTGLTSDVFQFQFRRNECDDRAELTISTADGTMSVAETDGVTTVSINVAAGALERMRGDYVADLVSKATNGTLTHRAHGVVTFRNDPIAF